jgi:hypothetical protein
MDQESLRLLIRRRLQNGRLPHDGIKRVWSSLSNGETCDGCDAILSTGQMLMEGGHDGPWQEAPSFARPMFPSLGSRKARRLAITAGLSQRLPCRPLHRVPRRALTSWDLPLRFTGLA